MLKSNNGRASKRKCWRKLFHSSVCVYVCARCVSTQFICTHFHCWWCFTALFSVFVQIIFKLKYTCNRSLYFISFSLHIVVTQNVCFLNFIRSFTLFLCLWLWAQRWWAPAFTFCELFKEHIIVNEDKKRRKFIFNIYSMYTHIDALISSLFSLFLFLFISIFTSFFFARYVLCAILFLCVCRCISHGVCCSFAKIKLLDFCTWLFTSEKLRQFHHPTTRHAYGKKWNDK